MMRAHHGHAFDGEVVPHHDGYGGAYRFDASRFHRGYTPPQAFFRHQLQRLMTEAGLSYAQALAVATQAGGESWHGILVVGQRPGMTVRMNAHIAGWNAEDALIGWLFSYAADLSGVHPTLRDKSFQPTSPHQVNANRTLIAGEKTGVSEEFHALSGYIVRLLDDRVGTGWTFTSTVPVRWGIIRTK
jgi:hypothetical protein